MLEYLADSPFATTIVTWKDGNIALSLKVLGCQYPVLSLEQEPQARRPSHQEDKPPISWALIGAGTKGIPY